MSEGAPLNFAVLVGSIRTASISQTIADFLPGLAPAGVSFEQLESIGDFPLYNHDIQAEGFPPIVTRVADRIRAADGVMIVTPEYNYSIPGILKNAIDWLSRLQPQPFAGKVVAIQTSSPGPVGGARVQYHLRQVMVFLDALVINKPEVLIAQSGARVDPVKGTLEDEASAEFIRQQLANLAATARRWQRGLETA